MNGLDKLHEWALKLKALKGCKNIRVSRRGKMPKKNGRRK
jgi:hypothetical protein